MFETFFYSMLKSNTFSNLEQLTLLCMSAKQQFWLFVLFMGEIDVEVADTIVFIEFWLRYYLYYCKLIKFWLGMEQQDVEILSSLF